MLSIVFVVILQDKNGQKLWLNECPACHNSLLCFGAYLHNQLKLNLDRVISDYHKASFIQRFIKYFRGCFQFQIHKSTEVMNFVIEYF